MKAFVALPPFAVVFLVSLCGSPVPSPPSDVSGVVFFDANRNGIKDACDSSLVSVHLVLRGEKETLKETAGGAGKFTFEDVSAGDYVLTFDEARDPLAGADAKLQWWPVTTANVGYGGMAVTVAGSDVTDVELGSATTKPLDPGPRVIGLAYNDADGDGRVGEDECGISYVSTAVEPPDQRAPTIDTPGSFHITTTADRFGPITALPPVSNQSWWVQTSPPPPAGACSGPVEPRPRYADGVYELNVGFQYARGTASITGVAFVDEDGDGVRGPGEESLDTDLSISPDCSGEGRPLEYLTALRDAGYERSLLPGGTYIISSNRVGEFLPPALLAPVHPELRLTVEEGKRAVVDFPFRRVPSGIIEVHVFDDNDGNGTFDEPGDVIHLGSQICYRSVEDEYEGCTQGRPNIQLPPGTYELRVNYIDRNGTPVTVEVVEGQTVEAFIVFGR